MTVDLSKYNDILRRLSNEALACVPEVWDQGRLTISITEEGSLHYVLEGDSDETPATHTQQLGKLCGELYIRMEMGGQQWSRCIISFAKTLEDSWGFEVKFAYPEPSKV
jgi:hypothetical protein